MQTITDILPILLKLVEKKKCAINVSTIDNEIVVNILGRFKKRCFKSADSGILLSKLNAYCK